MKVRLSNFNISFFAVILKYFLNRFKDAFSFSFPFLLDSVNIRPLRV